jgi:hypothetical protein
VTVGGESEFFSFLCTPLFVSFSFSFTSKCCIEAKTTGPSARSVWNLKATEKYTTTFRQKRQFDRCSRRMTTFFFLEIDPSDLEKKKKKLKKKALSGFHF